MKLAKAIRRLKAEYERAKQLDYVRDPVAFALYSVWKEADHEAMRKMRGDKKGRGEETCPDCGRGR